MAKTQPDGLLDRFTRPYPLLLGVVVSFLGCCLLGQWVSSRNIFRDFIRFHSEIEPVYHFYPTPRQVCSLAEDKLDRKRIAVIVGGNSILNGVGQNEQHLWSVRLQELLGDDYRVVNLAMRGAASNAIGGLVAEILAERYKRLIFVTILATSTEAGVPDGSGYRFFFAEALAHGLVPPHPQREQWLSADLPRRRALAPAQFDEQARGFGLDAQLNYRDLWTAFHYHCFNTIWCPGVRATFFRPRGRYPDSPYPQLPVEQRYPPVIDAQCTEIAKGMAAIAPSLAGTLDGPPDPATSPLVKILAPCYPEHMRPRTLFLVVPDSPHYVNQLPDAERSKYRRGLAAMARVVEAAGYGGLAVGEEWNEWDFYDRCHLSEQGGQKLAEVVAPKVHLMAQRLGYVSR